MAKKRFPLDLEIANAIHHGAHAGILSNEDLRHQIFLGRFPLPMVSALGIPDLDVVTSVSVLAKLAVRHNLSAAVIASLHRLISTPSAVFNSASRSDSIVIVSPMFVRGNPLISSVVVDTSDAYLKPNVHWLTSAYGKDNHAKLLEWEREGLLKWRP